MLVVRVKAVEDCFEGSFIKEFALDGKISKDFIMKLGEGCSLEYFPDFPRPFFRIEKKHQFQIKGVENSNTMQIIFYRTCTSECVQDLINLIHKAGSSD